MQLSGHIIAGYQHPASKKFVPVVEQKNLILFEAADIMAQLLAGRAGSKLNYMYFQYQNTNGSVTATPSLNRSLGRGSFTGINGSDFQDWIRVPIVIDGLLGKYPESTTDYQNNAATFSATSALAPADPQGNIFGESPAHNYFASSGVNGKSQIFSVALVAGSSPSDSTQDKIFSRVNLDTPFDIKPGLQVAVYWIIRFI